MYVANLLAKTDSRTGVEGDEDERIGYQILLPVIQEAIWIELVGCKVT